MIPLPPSTWIFLACGATDMRKGFDGLAVMTQQVLEQSPHSGALFAFCGNRGDLVKLLWYDGQDMCLFSKRMDRGRFVWPSTKAGSVVMSKPGGARTNPSGVSTPSSSRTAIARAVDRCRPFLLLVRIFSAAMISA